MSYQHRDLKHINSVFYAELIDKSPLLSFAVYYYPIRTIRQKVVHVDLVIQGTGVIVASFYNHQTFDKLKEGKEGKEKSVVPEEAAKQLPGLGMSCLRYLLNYAVSMGILSKQSKCVLESGQYPAPQKLVDYYTKFGWTRHYCLHQPTVLRMESTVGTVLKHMKGNVKYSELPFYIAFEIKPKDPTMMEWFMENPELQ